MSLRWQLMAATGPRTANRDDLQPDWWKWTHLFQFNPFAFRWPGSKLRGYDLSVGGFTHTAVQYSRVPKFGGGTIHGWYFTSLAGAFAFIGAVAKWSRILRAGTFTFSGILARAKLSIKTLAGIFTFSGLVTKYSQVKRAGILAAIGTAKKYSQVKRTGIFAFVGVVKKSTQVLRVGVLAFSGIAKKYTRIFYTGVLVLSGFIGRAKFSVKALVGALAFAGSVIGIKITAYAIAVGGVLAFSGTVGKLTRKIFQGALDFADYLIYLFTGLPQSYLNLITPADERIFIDGRAATVFALATAAEDAVELQTPAIEAIYLQCPPIGGPAW